MDQVKMVVDTSAWLALILINERFHEQVENLFRSEQDKGTAFYTTNDIIDETVTRLVYDQNLATAKKFIKLLSEQVKVRGLAQMWTDEQIQEEAFGILEKFSDHKLSLTDATTVAIMKRFNLGVVLTLDSDFREIGISSLP